MYIETNIKDVDDAHQAERKFLQQVWAQIGDQKIDIVMNMLKSKHQSLAIYEIARNNGIQLI